MQLFELGKSNARQPNALRIVTKDGSIVFAARLKERDLSAIARKNGEQKSRECGDHLSKSIGAGKNVGKKDKRSHG